VSDSVAEFYRCARYVWRRWSGSAGWRERLSYEDAIQSAVLRCWIVRDRYDPTRASRATFFVQCARREMAAMAAKAAVRRKVTLTIDAHSPLSAERSPVDATVHAEDLERLSGALGALKPNHRRVLALRVADDLLLSEAASVLECSHQAVQQLEQRAMEKLTTNLARGMVTA
jgi:RNA polymerase sigma factor (sigma-70 family)